LEELLSEGAITLVLVNGQELCCKSGEPDNWKAVAREADCLWKIANSKHASTIRAPKLKGLVVSVEGGQPIGILEEYIPSDENGLATLRDVDCTVVDYSRRMKWAAQIRNMVNKLHGIGVV
jgi:hypothetical protein